MPPRRQAKSEARAAASVESPGPGLFPSVAESTETRAPYLLPLLILFISRALAWSNLPFASEDAYITFRYARSLATGHGLAYNAGERVMGFTSPLWTAWMALGIVLVRDPVLWSRLSGMAADAVTLVVLTRLLERHAGRASAWCFAAFFALWPFFAVVAVSGMENALMLMLVALSAALAGRRSAATGPALGLLALVRPEGLAVAAVMACWARWRDRVVALAVAGAGIAALWAYYGSPIPQSVLAKSALYGTPGPWGGRFWWDWIIPFRLGGWPTLGDLNMLLPLVVLLFAGSAAGLAEAWKARRTGLVAAVAGCLVVWGGYSTLGVAYFFWYFLLPLVGFGLLASIGLPRLLRGRWVYFSCILYILGAWTIARILYVGRAQNEATDFGRVSVFLQANARPGQSVMLEPIGLVGYQNPLRVVDEIGLVSPRVARRRVQGPGWYTDIAAAENPEWLVVRRGVLEQGQAFAGAGAPFRSRAERDSLVARYALADPGNELSGAQALEILKRIR